MTLAGYSIAFDLDGTLVDSAPDIHRALSAIMAQQNLPPPSLSDVHLFVGQGARATIVRAAAVHGVFHAEPDLDRLTEDFTRIYASDIAALTRPMPGVEAALTALANAGAILCVCTNKRSMLSNRLLDALNLAHHFAAVVGADDVERKKPHPDHFIAAIRAAGGDPSRAMMVGDSSNDVNSAKAANAPVAVYAHGYTETAPALLGADAVFSHYDELPAMAARLFGLQTTPRA